MVASSGLLHTLPVVSPATPGTARFLELRIVAVDGEVHEPDASLVAAHQRDDAAARELLDAVRTHQLDEVVDLLGAAR